MASEQKRILLLASGSGSLAQAIFDSSLMNQCEVVGLVSDKQSMALDRARSAGVKDYFLPMRENRSTWDSEIYALTESLTPDLVVSVGFMRIHTHPALLPAFPGAHAVRDALDAGLSETGTSVHWVDAGVDTGPVIAQRAVAITPGESEETLHERIKIVERDLIVETLTAWLQEDDGAR